ncbi:MAG: hypothetical protein QOE70_3369 [Chthoniobacter sp.]|jgi:hypothetical protein|nr:hypothetical protein [Chthoniobacter sp.]
MRHSISAHSASRWPLILFALGASAGFAADAPRPVEFSRDVLPILSDNCFYCHGQDENHRKGDRRLDKQPEALAEHEGVRAIVPGDVEKSDLIVRIFSSDPDEVMPPVKEKKKLTAAQKELLKRWIAEGAKWGTHWAFTPPVRPELIVACGLWIADWEKRDPRVAARLRARQEELERWAQNPIDQFVLDRLLREGLTPSPEADAVVLCRRMHLDLIGLPPKPDEVDAFVAESIPDPQSAIRNLVERLLASPHYGERWGRDWLDAARYADSNGYEKDAPRSAWFYRDWVINAFNRDLPYDRFIIEQLAGDQLPNATQDQVVATGFLRNSMINEEGGADPEQFRMEAMFDRMETIGKSVLGLTIQCAQCHSHKFDPIAHEEYYQLFAFLNSDHEAQPVVYTPEEQMKRADLLRQIADTEQKVQELIPDWETRMAAWEEELKKQSAPEWSTVQPVVEDISTGGQRYLPQKDGAFVAAGFQPTKHEVKMTIKTAVQNITAFRLELLLDPGLPANGPGRSHLGTFGLTEFKVDAGPAGDAAKKTPVKFAKAIADLEPAPETPVLSNFNEKEPKHRVIGPASYAIDGNEETAWSNDIGPGRRNRECAAVFVAEKPIANEGGTELLFKLTQKHGGWNADDLQANNLGRFRLSITTSPNPDALASVPRRVREIFAVPREQRSPAQTSALFSYWRTTAPEAKELNAKIETLWTQHPEGTTQLALTAREDRRETHILKRGDWLKPGDAVLAGVPAVLNPLPADAPRTRLTFAKWLVDPKAPTTARVLVNRIWQHYFGTGIVATAEDFGVQSEAPSHPELLDWLACEFMEHGWSIKHLHRLIVSSATYRQSSKVTPELYQRDPYNRLLARGPRFRVEGEVVRDIQLTASGLLNPKLGGRSLMPPAPPFLFLPPVSYAPFPWIEETGPDRYRRAVYTYRRRTTPYPLLATFDTPEGNVACIRRARSNTPLQALVTLNETLSFEAAQALARRSLEEGGHTDAERIAYAFRRCLARPPSDAEREEMIKLIAKESARFADGWADPWLIATGRNERPTLPEGTTPRQLAAYTIVARVLLNLDETITKE